MAGLEVEARQVSRKLLRLLFQWVLGFANRIQHDAKAILAAKVLSKDDGHFWSRLTR